MIGQHRALCGGIARFFAADYGVTTKAGRKRRGYVQHLFQIEVPIIMLLLDMEDYYRKMNCDSLNFKINTINVKRYLLMLYSGIFIFAGFLLQVIKKLLELRVTIGILIEFNVIHVSSFHSKIW